MSANTKDIVEVEAKRLSPEAEALREKLDEHTCVPLLRDLGVSKEAEQAIRDQAVFLLARTIVEQLGITEESVDECICGAGYALGRCKYCDRRIDILSTLLELANHGE